MFPISSDILRLTDEPAALAKNGRVVFANDGALEVLGADCVGKTLRELCGPEIAEAQAVGYAASVPIRGKHRILRVNRVDGMQVIFFSRREADPSLINDAYLLTMRNGLMSLSLSTGRGRALADQLKLPELDSCFASLTKSYYMLMRLMSNVSNARDVLSGTLPVTLSTVDLSALCADLVESLSLLRPDIDFRFSYEKPILLWADHGLLELMLTNLLSNCLLHAEGMTSLELRLSQTNESVFVAVSDNGCGIPAGQIYHVFNRYRSNYDLSQMAKGAGLGLTVVRGVAEAHRGALLLESREGIGTLVRVSLSRSLGGESALRGPAEPYTPSMEQLLVGLSGCLPEECFTEKYLN